jgi:membrane-bound metal-dependent hydrolase YbcI (DUF457 family)
MMLGKSHAISGAAVWLSGAAVAQLAGWDPNMTAVWVGAGVCAGCALIPDIDHPNSSVTLAAGPITKGISWTLARVGVFVHAHTKTRADTPDLDAHRTITHTLVWALLWGGLTAWGQQRLGPWMAAALVFLVTALGTKTALPKKHRSFHLRWRQGRWRRRMKVSTPLTVGTLSAAAIYPLTPGQGWWLGLAVFTGLLTHCLGDAVTNSGCPLLWPIRIQRKAWYKVGPPPRFRFDTGKRVEVKVVAPLLVFTCVMSAAVVVWPYVGPAIGEMLQALHTGQATKT